MIRLNLITLNFTVINIDYTNYETADKRMFILD